jgi:hypothetical protein
MFRELLDDPQEALDKRHLVYACVLRPFHSNSGSSQLT